MKLYLLTLILLICSLQMIHAQEDDGVVSLALPVRNSLTFNRYLLNPTFSFVREQHQYVNMTNKREWTQFEDAPTTYFAGYSGRFKENIGVGVGVFQENYGVLTTFGGILNFAYNAQIQRDNNLTFGLNLGVYSSGVNTGRVVTNFPDPSLENVPSNLLVSVSPGINYGLAFLDFGVSINNAVLYNVNTSELLQDDPEQSIQPHIMYTGFIASNGFFDESKFSALARSEFRTDETIISGLAMLTVPKGIWAQLGYNTLYGASAGVGLNITSSIAIEYNYEQALGDLTDFGSSHEITLAYRFQNRERLDYSGDEEVAGLFTKRNKKVKPATINKDEAEANRRLAEERRAQLKIDAAEAKAIADQEAQLKTEEAQKAQLEAKEQAEIQAKLEAEEAAIAQEEAKAKAAIEAKAKQASQAEAKEREAAKAEAAAQLKAKQAAEAKAEADALAKVRAEEAAKAKVAKAKAVQEALALAEAEEAANAKDEAEAQAEAAEQEKLRLEAETAAANVAAEKAKAEAIAKAEAEAKAAEELRLKELAEIKAQELAEAKAEAEAIAQAKAEKQAEVQRAEAEKLRLEKEKEAKEAAEALAIAQASEAAAAKAKAEAIAQVEADKAAEAQRVETERLRLEQESTAKIAADAKAQADAIAQAKADEEAKAKLAEAEKAKQNAILEPADALGQSLADLTIQTENTKSAQQDLLNRLSEAVAKKDKDLKDLKKENDLSEQGIVSAPKPFVSVTAENNAIEALKRELDQTIADRNETIDELQKIYDERMKIASLRNDEVSLFYKKKIDRLKAEQMAAIRAQTEMNTSLANIKVATEIERKRRIKRAVYDSEADRYAQDRAKLKNIKATTTLSSAPLTESDFDFGEAQSDNIQILKNVQNVESGYYLIVAVHNDKDKRDEFVRKVVASGRTDVDFFYDVNTSKYFIYYQKTNSVDQANATLKTKGDRTYNSQMSIVKIEN